MTGPQHAVPRSPRRRRWLVLALGLVAVLVAVVVGTYPGDEPREPGDDTGTGAAPSTGPAPTDHGDRLTREAWTEPATGVFVGTDADGVLAYQEWLGRPVDLVVDFPPTANWFDISSPDYLFEEWSAADQRLVLSLPMLPSEVEGVSLAAGAQGAYDDRYRTLAERLVAYGLADTILRPGWEFDLATSYWHATDPATFVAYWRRIVETMTSVAGQEFRFAWNPNNGTSAVDAADFYPGDDVVDYVALDAYDVAGGPGTYPLPAGCTGDCAEDRHRAVWEDVVYGGERGLRFWSDFARERDKLMALPEWGIWAHVRGIGGGDNPYYIDYMHEFITDPDNRVAFHSYFEDDNSQGDHRLLGGSFPQAAERYRDLFSE